MLTVANIVKGSIADKHSLKPKDIILKINGEDLVDIIDYQALTGSEKLTISVLRDNQTFDVHIKKSAHEALGIELTADAFPPPRECANNCIFCFVKQMPEGMRPSLYIRDDDWRHSLVMGNFITLTNVGEREFNRIIKRKASPLYISVQATDPDLRVQLLNNKNAGNIMQRLITLKENGISYHLQLVLLPGINDGPQLERTLNDLYTLLPNALSVALVPVGLTKFRNALYPLATYTKEQATEVLDISEFFQKKAMANFNTHFAYPSDEFFCIAERPVPDASFYEGFPQIENGVGMIRQFEDELYSNPDFLETDKSAAKKVLIPCGTMIYPHLQKWISDYLPNNIEAEIIPIKNYYFGETVSVTGLITATDLKNQLSNKQGDVILLADSMLDSDNKLFLDNISIDELRNMLPIPIQVIETSGYGLYDALNLL
ncbi:MAG: DUF512 domain-containing protein [Eubacteriales bacterium]|nr:DUF512 domain-containing protein [Eubacteriales bacterium]